MKQAALPLDWPAAEHERDFIVTDSNRAAVRHLDHRGLWPVHATILTGPRKSGRSLLGRLFAARVRATLVDEAERVPEETLFHLWNSAQAERRPLLLIADAAPPVWQVALPDLRSRLAATPVAAIGDPDDALVGGLVEKLLGRRGLVATPALLAYLVPRIERTHIGVIRLVDALDEVALRRRTGLGLAVAREALAELGTRA